MWYLVISANSLAAQPLAVKNGGSGNMRILMLCTWNAILYQRPYESQGKECIISKVQKAWRNVDQCIFTVLVVEAISAKLPEGEGTLV